jgi:hypothetical protein
VVAQFRSRRFGQSGYNRSVPFTLAHGAAALPFRRSRLVISGVLIGTFAPDFEYFIRRGAHGDFLHTWAGVFLLTLPLALAVLWLFHAFIKRPVARLLPNAVQRRLANVLDEFHFGGAARFALIAVSVLLGIATHVAWDAFTHMNTWPYYHWAILRQTIRLPIMGLYPVYRVVQYASTIFGLGVLALWLAWWYLTTEPSPQAPVDTVSLRRKIAIWAVVISLAFAGATLQAVAAGALSLHHLPLKWLVIQFVVTVLALLWWELLAYGVFATVAHRSAPRPAPEQVSNR